MLVSYPASVVALCSVCLSLANLYCCCEFTKHRDKRPIASRHPFITTLYWLISFSFLFVVAPVKEIFQTRNIKLTVLTLTIDIAYDILLLLLNALIILRIWLLTYDYKSSLASVDQIWRQTINPNERNFWLHYKGTLGNAKFCFVVSSIFMTVICSGYAVIIVSFTEFDQAASVNVRYLVSIIFHCLSIVIIVIVTHKIQHINDQFKIRIEMLYLFVILLVYTFTITLIEVFVVSTAFGTNTTLLLMTVERVVTITQVGLVAAVQTQWVVKIALEDQKAKSHAHSPHSKSPKLEKKPSLSLSKSKSKTLKTRTLTMIDILRDRMGFELLMRHCIDELSVESLLFLVEVAQYKATMLQYNAPETYNLHNAHLYQTMSVSNLSKQSTVGSKGAFESKKFGTDPAIRVDDSGLHDNFDKLDKLDKVRNVHRVATTNTLTHPIANTTLGPPVTPVTGVPDSSEKQNSASKSKIGQSKGNADVLSQFQNSILSQSWLPIAWQLSPSRSLPKSENDDLRLQISNSSETETFEEENQNLPTFIRSNSSDFGRFGKSSSLSSESGLPVVCYVSAEWAFHYSKHLFEKYVRIGSDLCINISAHLRSNLELIYAKQTFQNDAQAIDVLVRQIIVQNVPEELDTNLLLVNYFYHIFDRAFDEVWALIQRDTFVRFRKSKEFSMLKTKLLAKKPAQQGDLAVKHAQNDTMTRSNSLTRENKASSLFSIPLSYEGMIHYEHANRESHLRKSSVTTTLELAESKNSVELEIEKIPAVDPKTGPLSVILSDIESPSYKMKKESNESKVNMAPAVCNEILMDLEPDSSVGSFKIVNIDFSPRSASEESE